jgi:hypothetical protein
MILEIIIIFNSGSVQLIFLTTVVLKLCYFINISGYFSKTFIKSVRIMKYPVDLASIRTTKKFIYIT